MHPDVVADGAAQQPIQVHQGLGYQRAAILATFREDEDACSEFGIT